MGHILFSFHCYKELGLWLLLGVPRPSTQSARELFPGTGPIVLPKFLLLVQRVSMARYCFHCCSLLSPTQIGVNLALTTSFFGTCQRSAGPFERKMLTDHKAGLSPMALSFQRWRTRELWVWVLSSSCPGAWESWAASWVCGTWKSKLGLFLLTFWSLYDV